MLLRTNRSLAGTRSDGAAAAGSQRVAGETSAASATFLGPTRRSSSGAIVRCQLAAAMSRSGCVIVTCASFSASAKVEPETGGPVTGPVPKVGGAPAVLEDEGDGFCGSVRHAAAAAIAATGAGIRNCRRGVLRAPHKGMGPGGGPPSGRGRGKDWNLPRPAFRGGSP